jgi:hypothetical protein
VLLATVQNWLLLYGPLHIICLRAVGNSPGSGSARSAGGPLPTFWFHAIGLSSVQLWFGFHVDSPVMYVVPARGHDSTCTWPWIHMLVAVYPVAHGYVSKWSCIHVVMYPRTSGHVSMCITWLCTIGILPCIHVHVAAYPHARGYVSLCMWLCIHMHVPVYPWPVAMYPLACGHIFHIIMYPWAGGHVFMCRLLLCPLGHSAEFCCAP